MTCIKKRPTPFASSYEDLVFDDDGWSQTIIVDGMRPEWLLDYDLCSSEARPQDGWAPHLWEAEIAIRVRRREPKRETVTLFRTTHGIFERFATIDLIDGQLDLSTLKTEGL